MLGQRRGRCGDMMVFGVYGLSGLPFVFSGSFSFSGRLERKANGVFWQSAGYLAGFLVVKMGYESSSCTVLL